MGGGGHTFFDYVAKSEVVAGKTLLKLYQALYDDNQEVLEGLNIGDEIVTHGSFTVDAAAQLQGKKSMMNKEGGKVMTGHEAHMGVEGGAAVNKDGHFNKNERISVSMDFQNQLKAVYGAYIKMANALALSTRCSSVKMRTPRLRISLSARAKHLLSAKGYWLRKEIVLWCFPGVWVRSKKHGKPSLTDPWALPVWNVNQ